MKQSDELARQWYTRAAEAGDGESQLALATMYQFGRYGAQMNLATALKWYERAANQGHARAQFALGKLLAAGEKVQQNDEAAFQWLTLAIMNGNEPAKRELAMVTARLDPPTLERYKQNMLQAMQGADGHG